MNQWFNASWRTPVRLADVLEHATLIGVFNDNQFNPLVLDPRDADLDGVSIRGARVAALAADALAPAGTAHGSRLCSPRAISVGTPV
jgi:hypothetical protein